jgi:tetratricopeptide (TPR) repeat protein
LELSEAVEPDVIATDNLLDLAGWTRAVIDEQAIALKPDHADAYNNRGVALQDLKRPEEALASYDKAIALKPDFAEACTVYMAAVMNTSLTLGPSARCCAKRR